MLSCKSLIPLFLSHEQESASVYAAFINAIKDMNGIKDCTIVIGHFETHISMSILSCDAKAAALIFGAKSARSTRDFCPYRCAVSKDNYMMSESTERLSYELTEQIHYVVCVLHLRIRLMGHIMEYIRDVINTLAAASRRRELFSELVKELQRCHCPVSIVCMDDKDKCNVYDPTGDIVDKMSQYKFAISNIFGMSCQ